MQSINSFKWLAGALLSAALLFPMGVRAELVQWEAVGHVWFLIDDGALESNFSINDFVRFSFSYDTESTPVYVSQGRELGVMLTDLQLQIGQHHFDLRSLQQNSFHPFAAIKNNQSYDEMIVGYVQLSGLTIPNLQIPEFYFGLVDFTSTRFDSLLAPPTNLGNLICSPYCSFISYEDPDANASRRAVFQLDSISVSVVPEPSSLILLSVGFTALVSARRRTKRLITSRMS